MGTNYYARPKGYSDKLQYMAKDMFTGELFNFDPRTQNYLKEKMEEYIKEELHIGKHSVGWKFHFQKTKFWKSFKDVVSYLVMHDIIVVDEYGEEIKTKDFFELIKRSYENEENKIPEELSSNEYRVDYLDEEGCWFSDCHFR